MPYIYSGVCLAAMFGSIIHEHRRLKSEASEFKENVKALLEKNRPDQRLPKAPAVSALGLA
jgi:hypothetical protein